MKHTFTDTTIKHHRKIAKFKQSELAEILGVTATDMSFIENKVTYPSLDIADRLSQSLKVTIGTLYSDAELNLMRERAAQ